MKARKRITTPEEWATGANIELFDLDGKKIGELSLFNVRDDGTTAELRQRCRDIRDGLIEKINA